MDRDYSSISPSAQALLLLKGWTDIPFAREVAAMMVAPVRYEPDLTDKPLAFWLRLLHFETRYWSIDQLMSEQPIKNILELSSGFSFRGLAAVTSQEGLHYIDTDLPEVITIKQRFVEALLAPTKTGSSGLAMASSSRLEITPLNALDEMAFLALVDRFPPGPVAIINEGLLVYLDGEEKRRLCRIIRKVLLERGGYWITADIYVRQKVRRSGLEMNDDLAKFFEEHRIEENKFESIEAAETFFREEGFVIDKEAAREPERLKSLPEVVKRLSPEQLAEAGKAPKIQVTWRLRPDAGMYHNRT